MALDRSVLATHHLHALDDLTDPRHLVDLRVHLLARGHRPTLLLLSERGVRVLRDHDPAWHHLIATYGHRMGMRGFVGIAFGLDVWSDHLLPAEERFLQGLAHLAYPRREEE